MTARDNTAPSVLVIDGQAYQTSGFNPSALRKGQKVLVVAEVNGDGPDADGEVPLVIAHHKGGWRNAWVSSASILVIAEQPLAVGDKVRHVNAPPGRDFEGRVVNTFEHAGETWVCVSYDAYPTIACDRRSTYRRVE